MNWEDLKEIAFSNIRDKPREYHDRLRFEIEEIEKQGATAKFINAFDDGNKLDGTNNKLLILWAIGLVDDDPIATRKEPLLNTTKVADIKKYIDEHGSLPSDIKRDPDMPDIDIDCLPDARDHIKRYAMGQYDAANDGYGSVCSVGTWQTYKFKSALVDVCVAHGMDRRTIQDLTSKLPQDVDDIANGGVGSCKAIIDGVECGTKHKGVKCPKCGSEDASPPTIGMILRDFKDLRAFAKNHPKMIDYAIRLVGCIRNMGMHAGALIITDRPLYGNIPLAKPGKDRFWVSMWTEGRRTQLSKLGYVKWDVLGLNTLSYIYDCCKLIQQNRGISFGKKSKRYKIIMKDKTERVFMEDDVVETDSGAMSASELYGVWSSRVKASNDDSSDP